MLALLILLPSLASAQTNTGSVRGTIIDPNGALVPGAQVKLVNEETSETRTMVSGEEGEFAFSPLVPGSYRLEIVLTGFAKSSQQIALEVGQELRQDVSLKIEGVTEAIDEDLGSIFSSGLGIPAVRTVIDNRKSRTTAIDRRSFYELTLLVRGGPPHRARRICSR